MWSLITNIQITRRKNTFSHNSSIGRINDCEFIRDFFRD
jgi:hypothetical protein